MEKKEFATFVAALRTYFPRETILPNAQATELWYMELNDIPYNVAMMALREHVHTSKWSPSISELRERAAEIQNGESPDWGEGWATVQQAIRRKGMYREQEALESMDEITRATVERLGYQSLCLSENPVADRARFRDIFEQVSQRKKRESLLPESLRLGIRNERAAHAIGKAAERMQIDGKRQTDGSRDSKQNP